MKEYIRLMRVPHFVKNLLVFAALACSGQLFNPRKFLSAFLGFAAFCAVSSAIYIINDIKDVEKDRCHPTKCKRPIAAGTVSVRNAGVLAIILLSAAALCSRPVFSVRSAAVLTLYLVLNLGYSFGLKNVPILDISILATGFFLRVVYGAFIAEIDVSSWLYLTVIVLSFYFALGKRRNEIKKAGVETPGKTRKVLQAYPARFLDANMGMCLTLATAFYALWSRDEKTMLLYRSSYLIFTVPLVIVILFKYSLDIEGDSDGDPVSVLLHDKVLLSLCALYAAAMFSILYL